MLRGFGWVLPRGRICLLHGLRCRRVSSIDCSEGSEMLINMYVCVPTVFDGVDCEVLFGLPG